MRASGCLGSDATRAGGSEVRHRAGKEANTESSFSYCCDLGLYHGGEPRDKMYNIPQRCPTQGARDQGIHQLPPLWLAAIARDINFLSFPAYISMDHEENTLRWDYRCSQEVVKGTYQNVECQVHMSRAPTVSVQGR